MLNRKLIIGDFMSDTMLILAVIIAFFVIVPSILQLINRNAP